MIYLTGLKYTSRLGHFQVTRFHTYAVLNKTGNVISRNTEARLPKHCCLGKAINIAYFCVCWLVGACVCLRMRCTRVAVEHKRYVL